MLDLLYPRRCPLCGEIRPIGDSMACPKCMQGLKRVQKPHCMKCGKSIVSEEMEYCQDCMVIPKHYERGFPVFDYTGAIKASLYGFKYKNQRAFATFYAKAIYECHKEAFSGLSLDGIVPVPIHRKKMRKRGYNQAQLIAKELSKDLKIPVFSDYLERQINTNPQKELDDLSRLNNLKNAFKMGKNNIKLKKILLVDDIYTSGATIEACTRVLLAEGTEQVYYTSVAIGKGYDG